MSSQSPSETTPLLDANPQPAGRPSSGISRVRSRFSPETLLIPVAFATTLAMAIPSTTFIELLRRVVCDFWSITHGSPTTLQAGGPNTPGRCDTPEVARYFATVNAVLGATEGIISMAIFGILSRFLSQYRRKPAFLCILVIRITGSCLVPVSQLVPSWLTGWVFFSGMLFELFSGLLPYGYLLNIYIFDVCVPENRTAALSKISGWTAIGTCISFSLGGFITTKTGNPLIVFYISAAIFVATFFYVLIFLPETFPEEKANELSRMRAERSAEERPKTTFFGPLLLIVEPLKMFIPKRNWRLTWCGAHIFMFMLAHTYATSAWLVLATSKYHLTPADTGIFLTSVTISGAIVLTLIVPWLVRVLKPYYSLRITSTCPAEEGSSHEQEPKLRTSDRLDVHLAFISCIFAGIFLLCAAAFPTNGALIVSGIGLGFTFMHGPTIRSLVGGSVDPLHQGEALAAIEMITQIGCVLSSIIMGGILSKTIDTMPLLLFYVHLVLVSVSGILLFLIRDADRYENPREL